jgi:hypothetical protein
MVTNFARPISPGFRNRVFIKIVVYPEIDPSVTN